MDQSVLVNIELQRGAEVLAALDEAKVAVSVALFARLAEYGDWQLVLAARAFDERKITEAYGLLFSWLTAAGIGVEKTPSVLIFSMNDPFIRELRKIFGKTQSVEGMRLGGQLIGGRFVEDGYLYRVR